MKRTMSPAGPDTGSRSAARKAPSTLVPAHGQTGAQRPLDVFSRIKLAFLDEYTCEKPGYDPYDTCRHRATPDIWVNKRKRA